MKDSLCLCITKSQVECNLQWWWWCSQIVSEVSEFWAISLKMRFTIQMHMLELRDENKQLLVFITCVLHNLTLHILQLFSSVRSSFRSHEPLKVCILQYNN